MEDQINQLLRHDGFVLCREHPTLARTIRRRCQAGELTRLHPGVFSLPDDPDIGLRLRALCRWAVHGVLHAETAAALWFQEPVATPITLANPRPFVTAPGVRVTLKRIPDAHVRHTAGLRLVSPQYCAAAMAGCDDGRTAIRMFRQQLTTPHEVSAVAPLFAGTADQQSRTKVLRELKDNPWSPAERLLQRLLNEAGIVGWRANPRLRIAGKLIQPDLLFDHHRLVVEVDGYAFHSAAAEFQRDRERQNQLVLAGFTVLRFTWIDLTEQPRRTIHTIRRALAGRNLQSDWP
jgi:very-short-patch-repair endonuclease